MEMESMSAGGGGERTSIRTSDGAGDGGFPELLSGNDNAANNGDPTNNKGLSVDDYPPSYRTGRTARERWNSAKSFIRQHPLRVISVLATLVLLLFMIVVILAAIIGSRSVVTYPMRCESVPCLDAASSVIKRLDLSYDSCNNFYRFSCGSFIKHNAIPVDEAHFNMKSLIQRSTNRKLVEILHQTHTSKKMKKNDEAYRVTKALYDACMDLDAIKLASGRFLTTYVYPNLGGGLSVHKSKNTLKPNAIMLELQTVYGVHPFFKIDIQPDNFDPTTKTIVIMPSEVSLPSKHLYSDSHKEITNAYKDFVRQTLQELDTKPGESTTLAETFYGIEKRIALAYSDYPNATIPWVRLPIERLKSRIPAINWEVLMKKYDTGARETTKVTLVDEEYFNQLAGILSSLDEKSLNDYMIWLYIQKNLVHLARPLRDPYVRFQRLLNGAELDAPIDEPNNWEFCIEQVKKHLSVASTHLIKNDEFDDLSTHHQQSAAERLVESVRDKLIGSLSSLKWVRDSQTLNNIRDKIRAMKVTIGVPESFPVGDSINRIYNTMQTSPEIIRAVAFAEEFKVKNLETRLKEHIRGSEWPFPPFDPEIYYEYAGNELYIGFSLLNSPIFNADNPDVVTYGSFVFHLVREMLKAIDERGIYYDQNQGKLFSNLETGAPGMIISERSYYSMKSSRDCFHNDMRTRNGSYVSEWHHSHFLPSLVQDIDALSITYNAYRDLTSRIGQEHPLPGLSFENHQLFFIAFAQSMCESTRSNYERLMNGVAKELSAEQRVEMTVRNVAQFSQSFNCHRPPKMECF
ncbi:endothelin-converting enzyme 1-like [Brevipalpus obovatus]|uniref:endothelin-converting enzyme 1-like n=1 Tax=Brevipalpus obovatus TaxID=246614 RepID=UPI003D9F70E1